MDTVVWQGSGRAWPGTFWDDALVRRLTVLGRRPTVVLWGDHGVGHAGRPGVLHVFTGGLEPVSSGSADMAARLDPVRAAVDTADQGGCSVVGICLAQMIGTGVSGLVPRPVGGGGEAGLTLVTGCDPDVPDLAVPTAHVAEVPGTFLALPGVRHLWRSAVTTVQGFAVGNGVVGVQFHPEFSAREPAGRPGSSGASWARQRRGSPRGRWIRTPRSGRSWSRPGAVLQHADELHHLAGRHPDQERCGLSKVTSIHTEGHPLDATVSRVVGVVGDVR